MKRVVYLLGAGFSAPLGLPLMSQFYKFSNKQFANQRDQYAYFDKVFTEVDSWGRMLAYYETNVWNIEDILSLLEMKAQLDGDSEAAERFKRFIRDVITYHTPKVSPERPSYSQTPVENIFWDRDWSPYQAFVSALFHVNYAGGKMTDSPMLHEDYKFGSFGQNDIEYSVITLNYDLVLENACNFLNSRDSLQLRFKKEWDSNPLPPGNVYLAKLHGSVDGGDIIGLTWRKNLPESILSSWKLAKELLREADEIRIVGYSLQKSDSDVRDLLRVAAIGSRRLDHITVLCKDNEKREVEQRYQEFMGKSTVYHFKNTTIENYLFFQNYNSWNDRISFDVFIEQQHRALLAN